MALTLPSKSTTTNNSNIIIYMALIFVTVAQFASTLYLPSLPVIANALSTSQSAVQSSVAVYLMALGTSQLFYGPLSDYFGRKPLLLVGMGTVLLGTVMIACTNEIEYFLIARAIQGFGAGAASLLARSTIRDSFHEKKLTSALAYLVMVASITPAISPLIGGHLQAWFGWRAIFIILGGYISIVIAGIIYFFPETNQHRFTAKINFATTLQNYRKLLQNKTYLRYVLYIILGYSAQILYITISPFIFQEQLGLTPAQYGSLIILPAAGLFLGSFTSLWLNKLTRLSIDTIILIGISSIFVSGATLAVVHMFHTPTVFSVLIPLVLNTFGFGLIAANALTGFLKPFPMIAGTAAALSGFLQMLGSGSINIVGSYSHMTDPQSLGWCLITLAIAMIIITLLLRTSNKY